MRSSIFSSGRLAALCGFLSSVALGCVITVGDGGKQSNGDSCPGDNIRYDDGECFCDIGYDWCNEDDLNDLTCCVDTTSNSNSNSNSNSDATSNTASNSDGTTEPTSGTTAEIPTTSGGTTGEPVDCTVEVPPPESCIAGEDFLCLSAANPDCGTEGSKFYVCTNGAWVENPNGPNENCVSDGYDFGYGCVDEDNMVKFECGIGPGTPCEGGDTCNGETLLEICYQHKLSSTDCTALCMEVGDGMGITYDYGYCGEQDSETLCICCDEGDDGCPINPETSSTGDATTGEGTSTGTTGG